MDRLPFVNIESDLSLYEYGLELRTVYGTTAWEVIVDTIRSYVDRTKERLIALPPGDETVPTAHAAASALNDLYNKFLEDTKSAVDFANHPSDELLQYLHIVRNASDVKKAMGVK